MQKVLNFSSLTPIQRALKNYSNRFIQSAMLLTVISIILLFFEIGIPVIFINLFNSAFDMKRMPDMFFYIACSFLFFFLIPVILNKLIYKEKLYNLGLVLPKKKVEAILLILFALAILIPLIIFFAHQTQFKEYYSLHQQNIYKLIFFQTLIFPMYYFCEEFFFRGFMLNLLWQKVGWHSFWITDIIFTFAHIFKPLMEIVIALPAGVIFAYLALTTRSILPSIVVHYILGIVMIVVVNHKTFF